MKKAKAKMDMDGFRRELHDLLEKYDAMIVYEDNNLDRCPADGSIQVTLGNGETGFLGFSLVSRHSLEDARGLSMVNYGPLCDQDE